MDIIATHSTTPQKSIAVARKNTSISPKLTVTNKPRMKVGSAMASDGPIRVAISRAMSRPSSARPKSKANMRIDLSKKIVSVSCCAPAAALFTNSGLS